jgi:hypothetical protein
MAQHLRSQRSDDQQFPAIHPFRASPGEFPEICPGRGDIVERQRRYRAIREPMVKLRPDTDNGCGGVIVSDEGEPTSQSYASLRTDC